MAHQHCRADYAHGLLTAKGAIAYWVRNQENQEIDIDPDELRNLFKQQGVVTTERSYKVTKGEVQL